MIIHFFKDRTKERIDFGELIDGYFDKLDNSRIASDDESVTITIEMREFGFEYSYNITKRTRISCLYRLNSLFANINMYIDIPCLIPQYISRLIFQQIGEICEKFDLQIFYEHDDNIKPFDMFSLIAGIAKEKQDYINAHPDEVLYKMPMNILNDMCEYQVLTKTLGTHFKNYVNIPDYTVMYDKTLDQIKLGIVWKKGTPIIIPPYLDYILIEADDALEAVVPFDVFAKHAAHLFDERDYSVGFKIQSLNERGAIHTAKRVIKMQKYEVNVSNFDFIKINNLTEN